MTRTKWLLGTLFAIALIATSHRLAGQDGQTGQAAQEQDVDEDRYQFRVSVDLISLNVTVTDFRNRFITDLTRDDFRVFEDGVHQELDVFSQEDLPLRMILLLDSSASMEEKMGFAQQAAVRFVGQMKDDDLTEVVEFGSKAHIIQPFTANAEELSKAILRTQAGGTTSLYNALYIALKDLSRRRSDIRRQAIVVLSDGEDTSSLVSFDQVLELTKDTDVTIYTISLRREGARKGKVFLGGRARPQETGRRDGRAVVFSRSHRRAGVGLHPHRQGAQEPVQHGLLLEQHPSRRLLAPRGGADHLRGRPPRPHQAGLLRTP